jgi:YHS domain-containing protein
MKAHLHSADQPSQVAIDPVCGMEVDSQKAKHREENDVRTYYFCSAGCKDKFLADPNRYLSARKSPQREEAMPEARFTRAPCIPKSARLDRDPAPSAAWLWNRWWRAKALAATPSSPICRDGFGLALLLRFQWSFWRWEATSSVSTDTSTGRRRTGCNSPLLLPSWCGRALPSFNVACGRWRSTR